MPRAIFNLWVSPPQSTTAPPTAPRPPHHPVLRAGADHCANCRGRAHRRFARNAHLGAADAPHPRPRTLGVRSAHPDHAKSPYDIDAMTQERSTPASQLGEVAAKAVSWLAKLLSVPERPAPEAASDMTDQQLLEAIHGVGGRLLNGLASMIRETIARLPWGTEQGDPDSRMPCRSRSAAMCCL